MNKQFELTAAEEKSLRDLIFESAVKIDARGTDKEIKRYKKALAQVAVIKRYQKKNGQDVAVESSLRDISPKSITARDFAKLCKNVVDRGADITTIDGVTYFSRVNYPDYEQERDITPGEPQYAVFYDASGPKLCQATVKSRLEHLMVVQIGGDIYAGVYMDNGYEQFVTCKNCMISFYSTKYGAIVEVKRVKLYKKLKTDLRSTLSEMSLKELEFIDEIVQQYK